MSDTSENEFDIEISCNECILVPWEMCTNEKCKCILKIQNLKKIVSQISSANQYSIENSNIKIIFSSSLADMKSHQFSIKIHQAK